MAEFTLDTDTLSHMALFERATHVAAVDCLMTPACAFYVVPEGSLRRVHSQGRQGVDWLVQRLGRKVEVVERAADAKAFVRGLFAQYGVELVELEERPEGPRATVRVSMSRKGAAIGKGGANLNALRTLAKRHAGVEAIVLE